MAAGEETALSLFPEHEREAGILFQAGKRNVNSPLTSSMGRIFDAVAALLGIRRTTTYEGQAAVELQQIIDRSAKGAYSFLITEEDGGLVFDWRPVILEILSDIRTGAEAGTISLRFHLAVAELIRTAAILLRDKTKCSLAVLSGGVFQNDFLLSASIPLLEKAGFSVYTNELVPTNDGGISFGQAAAASFIMRR
jgi:hydrogenase maturation protein HypF